MQVHVKNLSDIPFVGVFKDKPITIPGGSFIEMGRSEAVRFLSEYSPVIVDGRGVHTHPKKLVMVEDLEAKAAKYGQPLKFSAFDNQWFRTAQGRDVYEQKLKSEVENNGATKPKRRRTAPKEE